MDIVSLVESVIFSTIHTFGPILCDESLCALRHPWSSVYYPRFGFCKFGSFCYSIHSKENKVKEGEYIKELKQTLQEVLDSLASKEIEILKPKHKIKVLENTRLISHCEQRKCEKGIRKIHHRSH